MHGFAGYFDTVLYGSVVLSTTAHVLAAADAGRHPSGHVLARHVQLVPDLLPRQGPWARAATPVTAAGAHLRGQGTDGRDPHLAQDHAQQGRARGTRHDG